MSTGTMGKHRGIGHSRRSLAAVAVLVVAVNLRTAVTSASPLVRTIASTLNMSGTEVSVFSALPVFCFGLMAPLALVSRNRLGTSRTLTVAMLLLAVGLGVRVTAGAKLLLAGTVVGTTGIALANIVLPAYVKEECGGWAGRITGVYSASISAMAALAAVVSPVLVRAGAGWRGALGIWALPASLAAGVLLLVVAGRPLGLGPGFGVQRQAQPRWQDCWRERVWLNVIVMTSAQAVVYYSMLAWIPSIFETHGLSSEAAGTLLSVFSIAGVPMSLVLPTMTMRVSHQAWLVLLVTSLTGMGLAGLVVLPTRAPFVWMVLLGLGQGGIYALVLTFFIIKTHAPEATARLSLVAQMSSFAVAALGPFVLGELSDGQRSWRLPLVVLAAVLVPQTWCGVRAGLMEPAG